MSITNDIPLQLIAEAQAAKARSLIHWLAGDLLDWTEASVATVERLAGQLHDGAHEKCLAEADMRKEDVAKLLGWYMGEVFRRSRGGHWQCGETGKPGEMPIVVFPGRKRQINPLFEARQRVVIGPAHDLEAYYSSVTASE